MRSPIRIVADHGVRGSFAIARRRARGLLRAGYLAVRFRDAPRYRNPTDEELAAIEERLMAIGVDVTAYTINLDDYRRFVRGLPFPEQYHGGPAGGVWHEKVLEHFIAYERLGLASYRVDDIYVDVAACNSPWAKILREAMKLRAYAIDVDASVDFGELAYYRVENATRTSFENGSVRGMSLQCAYEMFRQSDDVDFLSEVARVLVPGGRAVIVPLYTHTHDCCYASPECYGRGFGDLGLREYIRMDAVGVPSSRKYSPETLKARVLDRAELVGLKWRLFALRNGHAVHPSTYCHFLLEQEKA